MHSTHCVGSSKSTALISIKEKPVQISVEQRNKKKERKKDQRSTVTIGVAFTQLYP